MTNFQLIKSKNKWKTSPNGRNFGRGKETGVGEWNDIQLIICQKINGKRRQIAEAFTASS